MVGGSGEHYVSERNAPQFEALLELMCCVVDAGQCTEGEG
jgi:hypothetical protein